jgi:hypothetical protein
MFHEIVPRNSGVAPAREAALKALHRGSDASCLEARPDTNRDVPSLGLGRLDRLTPHRRAGLVTGVATRLSMCL